MNSAPPIAPPGCPELAFSTIAADRIRMLSAAFLITVLSIEHLLCVGVHVGVVIKISQLLGKRGDPINLEKASDSEPDHVHGCGMPRIFRYVSSGRRLLTIVEPETNRSAPALRARGPVSSLIPPSTWILTSNLLS